MAAGTNWKRPWKEDDQHAYSECPIQNNRLPAHALTRQTLSTSKYGVQQDMEEMVSSPENKTTRMAHGTSNILSPSPHRPLGFLTSSEDHRPLPDSPPPHLKRKRVDYDQSQEKNPRKSTEVQRGNNDRGFGLEGDYAMSSDPDAAISVSDGRLRSVDQNVRLLELPGASSSRTTQWVERCQGCSSLDGVVGCIIKGLGKLQTELSLATGSSRELQTHLKFDYQKDAPNVNQNGLHQSLDWVLEKVDGIFRMAQDLVISEKYHLQQAGQATAYDDGPSQTSSFSDGREGKLEVQDTFTTRVGRTSPPPSEDGFRVQEISRANPSILHRRTSIREFQPPNIIPSPRPTISTRPLSPMQIPSSSRLLPSPSSMNFSMGSNILPPMSPSLLLSKSPHTAHLQELQHQLSTKSLAHQILLGEHDKLLAAFSRSRIRCEALDKKSQVSEHEINELSEVNTRFQAQIDAFEIQVEELQQGRDEAMRQSVASAEQYMKIMNMGSKLQVQATNELRRWKEDRGRWEREKKELLQPEVLNHQQNLEAPSHSDPSIGDLRPHLSSLNPSRETKSPDRSLLPNTSSSHPSNLSRPPPARSDLLLRTLDQSDPLEPSDPLSLLDLSQSNLSNSPAGTSTTSSIHDLHFEIRLLRQKNQDAETMLSKLRSEAGCIEDVIGTLEAISRRVRGVKGNEDVKVGEERRRESSNK